MSDSAEAVFEQYWLHARHQELQLLTFTSIYSAIVSGALVYEDSQFGNLQSRLFISLAIMIISVLGFFLTFNYEFAFTKFSRLAEQIKKDQLGSRLKIYDPFALKYAKLKGHFEGYKIIYYFYITMATLFTAILIWNTSEIHFNTDLYYQLIRLGVASFGAVPVFFLLRWKRGLMKKENLRSEKRNPTKK